MTIVPTVIVDIVVVVLVEVVDIVNELNRKSTIKSKPKSENNPKSKVRGWLPSVLNRFRPLNMRLSSVIELDG